MARRRRKPKPLPTIWRVPDKLWERIEPVLNELDPPARTGRKRIAPRPALEGIIYQMRTGCQWNVLPREFGDDSGRLQGPALKIQNSDARCPAGERGVEDA